MEQNQCNNQDKIPHTQQLLIQVHLNYQFHQMSLKKLELNGNKLFQILIAHQIKHFVMLRTAVKTLHQN